MPSALSCRSFKEYNSSEWCHFAEITADCDQDEGFVDYITAAFCTFPTASDENWLTGVYIIYLIWMFYLFAILAVTADSFFVPSLNWIAKTLDLNENIAGVTFVALGNGAPDIFGATAAFTSATADTSALAIGALLGAGAFIRLVVAGACIYLQPLSLPELPVIRDIIFSIVAIYWLFICLWKEKIELIDTIGFLVLYAGYVVVIFLMSIFDKKRTRTDTWVVDDTDSQNSKEISDSPQPTGISNANFETIEEESEPDDEVDVNEEAVTIDVGENPNFKPVLPMDTSTENLKQIQTSDHTDYGSTSNRDNPNYKSSEDEAVTANQSVEIIQEYVFEKTWKSEFKAAVTLFSWSEFSDMSLYNQVLNALTYPVVLWMTLTVPIIDENDQNISWNKPQALLQVFLIPPTCWLFTYQYKTFAVGSMPVIAIVLLISLALCSLVFFTSDLENAPKYYPIFQIIGFVVSIIWFYAEANEVVNILTALGCFWNISSTIMGILILAPANSIGDFVADFSLAKAGKAETAFGAVYGGPLLNVLIGIGLSCTIAIFANGHPVPLRMTAIEIAMAATVELALILPLYILVFNNFHFSRPVGVIFIVIYCICLGLVLAAGLDVFGEVPYPI